MDSKKCIFFPKYSQGFIFFFKSEKKKFTYFYFMKKNGIM